MPTQAALTTPPTWDDGVVRISFLAVDLNAAAAKGRVFKCFVGEPYQDNDGLEKIRVLYSLR